MLAVVDVVAVDEELTVRSPSVGWVIESTELERDPVGRLRNLGSLFKPGDGGLDGGAGLGVVVWGMGVRDSGVVGDGASNLKVGVGVSSLGCGAAGGVGVCGSSS